MSPGRAAAPRPASWPRERSTSFLIWHLTGGQRFVTDATNASRTLLMDLRTGSSGPASSVNYSAFRREYCPKSCPAPGEFGKTQGLDFLPDGIPITGVAGDQQASLIGQGCVEPGQAKCTYRHRRVPAGPHRRPGRPLAPRIDHDPGRHPGRSAAPSMPSRGACSSPVPPSSGSATGSRPSAPHPRSTHSPCESDPDNELRFRPGPDRAGRTALGAGRPRRPSSG